jgi:hypothetical protein
MQKARIISEVPKEFVADVTGVHISLHNGGRPVNIDAVICGENNVSFSIEGVHFFFGSYDAMLDAARALYMAVLRERDPDELD